MSSPVIATALFELGRHVATRGVVQFFESESAKDGTTSYIVIAKLILRHVSGDWGDLSPDDKEANDEALHSGGRLLSAYQINALKRVYIITEADRSATTVMLSSEY